MMVRRWLQFRLQTVLWAMLVTGLALGAAPHWLGPLNLLFKRANGPITVPRRQPLRASTGFPAGNPRTRAFLAATAAWHSQFCSGDLDAQGNLTTLCVYPCWPTNDEQLEIICLNRSLKSLCLSAENVTDLGIQHLESLPALQAIQLHETEGVSDQAFARLRRLWPGLVMTLFETETERPRVVPSNQPDD